MAVNFEIPTTEIKVGQGSFTVRGMNSEDLTFLVTHYLDDMKATVAKYGEKVSGRIAKNRVADLVMDLVKDFPMMVVEIISRAADSTSAEDIEKFRRLSFVKQVEAVKAVALLTVEDGEVELKKVGAVLVSLLEANGLQLGPLAQSLQTITTTFEKPSAS